MDDGGSFMIPAIGVVILIFVWLVKRGDEAQERERLEKYAHSLSTSEPITFYYCNSDSAPGVTRQTVQRLAEQLRLDENQVIHQALYELAARNAVLPRQG